ncbi:Phenylalanine--tRNA ligase beta subunit [Dissostichus eleginoides]|uniref:Phenylalanine--tRNA ligase beta subunit n=1 Tax=Dissostichus eleginoides TaxID=100907 RepID=A0AAD9BW56_DISEL|nr:Phenylalanine--tRNA ligase beta subunit [Dissostichus eleginoides]
MCSLFPAVNFVTSITKPSCPLHAMRDEAEERPELLLGPHHAERPNMALSVNRSPGASRRKTGENHPAKCSARWLPAGIIWGPERFFPSFPFSSFLLGEQSECFYSCMDMKLSSFDKKVEANDHALYHLPISLLMTQATQGHADPPMFPSFSSEKQALWCLCEHRAKHKDLQTTLESLFQSIEPAGQTTNSHITLATAPLLNRVHLENTEASVLAKEVFQLIQFTPVLSRRTGGQDEKGEERQGCKGEVTEECDTKGHPLSAAHSVPARPQ